MTKRALKSAAASNPPAVGEVCAQIIRPESRISGDPVSLRTKGKQPHVGLNLGIGPGQPDLGAEEEGAVRKVEEAWSCVMAANCD